MEVRLPRATKTPIAPYMRKGMECARIEYNFPYSGNIPVTLLVAKAISKGHARAGHRFDRCTDGS